VSASRTGSGLVDGDTCSADSDSVPLWKTTLALAL